MTMSNLNPVRSTTGSNVVHPTSRPMKMTSGSQLAPRRGGCSSLELQIAFWYVVKMSVPSGWGVPKLFSQEGKACIDPNDEVSLRWHE